MLPALVGCCGLLAPQAPAGAVASREACGWVEARKKGGCEGGGLFKNQGLVMGAAPPQAPATFPLMDGRM